MSQGESILLGVGLFAIYYAVVITIHFKRNKKKMKILCGEAQKKPVKIQFFIYSGWSAIRVAELKAWIESFGVSFWDVVETNTQGKLRIKTLEGSSYDLPDGYVIIRGVEGEFYPCEPSIFNKTYKICE